VQKKNPPLGRVYPDDLKSNDKEKGQEITAKVKYDPYTSFFL
jgi:hypothetical protein